MHGHVHRPLHALLHLPDHDSPIPIYDPGSSGYAKNAGLNVYEVPHSLNEFIATRYGFDGADFTREVSSHTHRIPPS